MRTTEQKANLNVGDWYTEAKTKHHLANKSGFALKRHCDNAHKGEVDPKCNACIELKRDMEEAQ